MFKETYPVVTSKCNIYLYNKLDPFNVGRYHTNQRIQELLYQLFNDHVCQTARLGNKSSCAYLIDDQWYVPYIGWRIGSLNDRVWSVVSLA